MRVAVGRAPSIESGLSASSGVLDGADGVAAEALLEVEGRVDRDAAQPRIERRLLLKGRQAGEGLQERVLDDVLDLDGVARVVAHQGEHARLIALDEQLEGELVAREGLADQTQVVLRGSFHGRDETHGEPIDARRGFLFRWAEYGRAGRAVAPGRDSSLS